MEIEHARAMAGMPIDKMLIEPSRDDPVERPIPIALPPVASIELDSPLERDDIALTRIVIPNRR